MRPLHVAAKPVLDLLEPTNIMRRQSGEPEMLVGVFRNPPDIPELDWRSKQPVPDYAKTRIYARACQPLLYRGGELANLDGVRLSDLPW